MSTQASGDAASSARGGGGGLLTNKKFRAIVSQVVVVALLAAFIGFIVHNTSVNLEKRNIASGFGFLQNPAGFDVAVSLIEYSPQSTHGRVYLVGVLNTLLIAVVGCISATFIGFGIGVLRLSHNWVVSRLAYCYVEGLRNIPLLLQIIFWWSIFLTLPQPRAGAIPLGDFGFLSNRGFTLPSPVYGEGSSVVIIAFFVAIVLSIAVYVWAHKRQQTTGQIFPVWWTALGLVFGMPLIAFFVSGMPIGLDFPVKKGFNFVGGFNITPEFFALWAALSAYTGAFIAEIVRAGIQAVNWGQTEASYALGLRPNWTMRLVVLPQALRVMVPLMTSQYLNLTKNSSLAIAVGYPDIVAVFGNTSLNQTGQAIEVISIIMATYLSFSLVTSLFMNWYNKKVALVER